jgi:hypothetical protein
MSKKTLIASCLACLMVGYLASTVAGFSPINPFKPRPDRPVVSLLRRLAKFGLWVAVFAEPQPAPFARRYSAKHSDSKTNVCHAEGW